jgi:hypothetical protein
LDVLAWKIPHTLIYEFYAGISNATAQTRNRVLIHTGDALNGTNARAFAQEADDRDFLLLILAIKTGYFYFNRSILSIFSFFGT